MNRLVNIISIVAGITLLSLACYLIRERYVAPLIPPVELEVAQPVKLQIPSLKINLPLIKTMLNEKGQWPTTTLGVSFHYANPNSTGTLLMYGHNWPRLLASLPNIQLGDEITIEMNSGAKVSYSVSETFVVNPRDTEFMSKTEGAQLVLYTCTGFLDRNRFVVLGRAL